MINYKQMIQSAPKDKSIMWKSIDHISDFINMLWNKDKHLARKFMFGQWEIIHGPHYNRELAIEEVSYMMSVDRSGNTIRGEIVTLDEAIKMLPSDKVDLLQYDAYVGLNGFAHDTSHADLSRKEMLAAGYSFYFEDDDFSDDHNKVWWYYSNL